MSYAPAAAVGVSDAPRKRSIRSRRSGAVAVGGILMALVATSAFAANPASSTTTTGQGLEVTLTPSHTGPVAPGTTVTVDSTATLTALAPSPVNYVYVVDVSGSMENSTFNPFQDIVAPAGIGPEDDCNADGIRGSAMDAACFGLLSLNESLGSASTVSVGLVAFGDGAVTADVDPGDADAALTSPPNVDKNGNGIPDMAEVIRSLDTQYSGLSAAGIGEFTNRISNGFAGGTNYNAALTSMNAVFDAAPEGRSIAAFISDGESSAFTTGAGSPLADAVAAGTVINTFAIGTIAPGSCDSGQNLRTIADETGGVCTEVGDPSTLSAVFSDVLATRIVSLDVQVNGTAVTDTSGSEASAMALSGIDISALLELGVNTITSTATAADGTTVTADVTIEVVAGGEPSPSESPSPSPSPAPSTTPPGKDRPGLPKSGV